MPQINKPSFLNPDRNELVEKAERRIAEMIDAKKDVQAIADEVDARELSDAIGEYTPRGTPSVDSKGRVVGEVLTTPDLLDSNMTKGLPSGKFFSKVMTAISLMFDRNPQVDAIPYMERYSGMTAVVNALIDQSHENENIREKWKMFLFDMAVYGTGIGFSNIAHRRVMIREEDLSVTEHTRVWEEFTNIPFHNAFIDERFRPGMLDAGFDWAYRSTITKSMAVATFNLDEDFFKDVSVQSAKTIAGQGTATEQRKDTYELWCYEDVETDCRLYFIGGKLAHATPLQKVEGMPTLRLVWAPFNIRNNHTPYGKGLYELMRKSKRLYDRFRKMNVDQTALSIYKMIFYQGSAETDDTEIKMEPGKAQATINPKDITFMDVPTTDASAVQREEKFAEDIDEDSGLSRTITASSSFNSDVKASTLSMAKEASLQKLRLPMDYLLLALEREAIIRWNNMQLINKSRQDVEELREPDEIMAFLEQYGDEDGVWEMDFDNATLKTRKMPVVQLPLVKDGDGYRRSDKPGFFTITPSMMDWNGKFHFNAEFVLTYSKELDAMRYNEMMNLVAPLFEKDPNIYRKPVTAIIRRYGFDPSEVLPDNWLSPTPTMAGQPTLQADGRPSEAMALQPVVPQNEVGQVPSNVVDLEQRVLNPRETGPQPE